MSPARQHRDRFAAPSTGAPAETSPAPAVPANEGGQPDLPAHTAIVVASPARAHRDRAAAIALAAQAAEGDDVLANDYDRGTPAERAAAEISMRLAHDLRRLKDIQSVERKIEAKREMLPAYQAWCEALIEAARTSGTAPADEVLPTMMVWAIDIANWPLALGLAEHVLAFGIPLPGRYARTAPTLIAEEVAEAGQRAQAAGGTFPLDVLLRIDELTGDADMHDQVRAKLMKAIGIERAAIGEALPDDAPERPTVLGAALEALRRAQALNERVGVKERIRKLEKLLAPATDAPGTPDAPARETA